MANKIPDIAIRGIRQAIPSGYVLGRTKGGSGQPHLIPITDIHGTPGAPGAPGTNGTNGTNGVGVPVGGTAGQVLAKIDGTDYNTHWVAQSGGGSGGVLPLVTGELPGPVFMNDGAGQTIGVPI